MEVTNKKAIIAEILRKQNRNDLADAFLKEVTDCEKCNGKCCQYVLLDIPLQNTTFDYLEYLIFHGISIYIEDKSDILIYIKARCNKLNDEGKCTIHEDESRPNICKDYGQILCQMSFQDEKDTSTIIDTHSELLANRSLIETILRRGYETDSKNVDDNVEDSNET
jgi:hypothetical protein